MGIASDLTRLATAKSDLKTAINAKGGTLDAELLDDYAAAVAALPEGVASGVSWDAVDGSGMITTATVYGTVIRLYSFNQQTALSSVTMDDVTEMKKNAFTNCTSLALTSLPSGLTILGENALYSCTGLLLTKLPDGLTTIGPTAFRGCAALRKIWIPDSVTTITAAAYQNGPWYACDASLVLYCEAASKPAGWSTYWNERASGGVKHTTNWDVTEAAFDAL